MCIKDFEPSAPYLCGHFCAHNIQLLASLHFEEVQEIGDSTEQDAAAHTNGLGKLTLLLLHSSTGTEGRCCAAVSERLHSPLTVSWRLVAETTWISYTFVDDNLHCTNTDSQQRRQDYA